VISGYTISSLAGIVTVTALDPRETDRAIFIEAHRPDVLDAAATAILRAADYEPDAEDVVVFVRQFMSVLAEQRSGSRTLRADIVRTWIEWRRDRRACA
jgi:hypothetical protein